MASASIRGIRDEGKAPPFDASLVYPSALLGRARALAKAESARHRASVVDSVRGLREAYTLDRSRLGEVARTAHRYVGGPFFLVRDLPKAASLAYELALRGGLPTRRTARVLDLGAGLGTTTFGYARIARALGAHDALEVDAVDSDPGVLERMATLSVADDQLAPIRLRTHATSLERFLATASGTYDVILVGLALNELAADPELRLGAIERAFERLSDDGILMIVEPALHATTRALMELRDRVATLGMPIVLPCVKPVACPMLVAGERDWCHVELDLALPEPEAAIADAVGLRDERLTFAPLVLRRQPLAEPAMHRLVSRPLGSKGKTEAVACDGSLRRLRELDRDRGDVDLGSLRRGSLIQLDPEPSAGEALRLGRDVRLSLVVR